MTKTLTSLDKVSIRAVEKEINEALAAVGKKFGLSLKLNGGKFDAAGADLKLKVKVLDAAPAAASSTREARAFKLYAPLHGIDPACLGQMITLPKLGVCKIVGWNTRAKSMPVLLETATGGGAKCGEVYLKAQFPAKKVA